MQRGQLKSDQYAVSLHSLYTGVLILMSLVLGGTLVLNIVESRYQYSSSPAIVFLSVHIAFLLHVLVDVVKIDAAFWNATYVAGITFVCGVAVALVIYGLYTAGLGREIRPS